MKVGIEPAAPAGNRGGAKAVPGRDQGFKSLLDQARSAGQAQAGEACQKEEKAEHGGSGSPVEEGKEHKEQPSQAGTLPEGLGILGELLLEQPAQAEGVPLKGEAFSGKEAVRAEIQVQDQDQIQGTGGGHPQNAARTEAQAAVSQETAVQETGHRDKTEGEGPLKPAAVLGADVPDAVRKEAGKPQPALGQDITEETGKEPAMEPEKTGKPGQPPAETQVSPEGGALPQTAAAGRETTPLAFRELPPGPGQEAAGLKTSEPGLPEDLGSFLSSRLPPAGRELMVELEPAHLGKLTVRVLYEGERALVSILTENPRTLELLSRHSPQIAAILEENTGQPTVVYTGRQGSQSQEGFERQGGAQDNPQQDRRQENRRKREQAESFYQRFRLGLI